MAGPVSPSAEDSTVVIGQCGFLLAIVKPDIMLHVDEFVFTVGV